jgi:hypothetical protein
MNKGFTSLAENWEDWKKSLTETDKTSSDYSKTLSELTDSVRELVGAGDDFVLTSDFVATNMTLIEEAASGSEKAINALGVATAKAAISQLQMDEALRENI